MNLSPRLVLDTTDHQTFQSKDTALAEPFRSGIVLDCFGVCAIVFYATHSASHLLARQPEHLLWACHIATLCVGIGLLCRLRSLNAIGALILLVGTPVWIVDVLASGEFIATSLLTHVGGLVISLHGLAHLGAPRCTWWKSWTLIVLLTMLSRIVTPADSNVNLAFSVPLSAGANAWGFAGLLTLWALALILVERTVQRYSRR